MKLICKICELEYEVERYRSKSKFCSLICTNEWRRKPENRLAISEIQRKRVALGLHNLYRGLSDLRDLIRHSTQYKYWRESVFKRDDFKCQICGVLGGKLNADHIKQFALVMIENNVESLEDAIKCAPLWDIANGRTLCIPCHRNTESYAQRIKKIIV